jgi:hypothetical protein
VKYGEDGANGGISHLGKGACSSPSGHPQQRLKQRQEVSVLRAFLEINHLYSTEMEREAGSGRRKCRFLNKQLIGLARVFNKNKRKCVLLQNMFSSLLSNLYSFCFIYIVSFEFELTSYILL